MKIKLSKWAKLNDITYKTAYMWYKNGLLPVKHEVTPSGSIFIILEEK